MILVEGDIFGMEYESEVLSGSTADRKGNFRNLKGFDSASGDFSVVLHGCSSLCHFVSVFRCYKPVIYWILVVVWMFQLYSIYWGT